MCVKCVCLSVARDYIFLSMSVSLHPYLKENMFTDSTVNIATRTVIFVFVFFMCVYTVKYIACVRGQAWVGVYFL